MLSSTFSYANFGISHTFDPSHSLVQSSLVSPTILAAIRASIALYCFTTIIFGYSWQAVYTVTTSLRDVNIPEYTITTNAKAIGQSFSYFTWLTFWSLGFYYLVSAVHTWRYSRYQRTWLHDDWPRSLQLAHSLWYTMITTFPFLVTITFWGTMYGRTWPEGLYEQWINLSVHGLNSLFALVEIVLPATSPRMMPFVSHLSVLLLVLSLYLGLAYLTRFTQGFYVYAWLDPQFGWKSIVLHIVAYTGAIIALFCAVRATIGFRYSRGQRSLQSQRRTVQFAGTRQEIRESEMGGWDYSDEGSCFLSLFSYNIPFPHKRRCTNDATESLWKPDTIGVARSVHLRSEASSIHTLEKISMDYHRSHKRLDSSATVRPLKLGGGSGSIYGEGEGVPKISVELRPVPKVYLGPAYGYF